MRSDPVPLAWCQHKNWHHDHYHAWYWNDYGCDDSVKSHQNLYEGSRPYVLHSPRTNTSAIGLIPATSFRLFGWTEQLMTQFRIKTATSFGSHRSCTHSLTAGLRWWLRVGRGARLAWIDNLYFGIDVHGATTRSRNCGWRICTWMTTCTCNIGCCKLLISSNRRRIIYSWEWRSFFAGCTHPFSRFSNGPTRAAHGRSCHALIARMSWLRPTSAPFPESNTTVFTLSPINLITDYSDGWLREGWCKKVSPLHKIDTNPPIFGYYLFR